MWDFEAEVEQKYELLIPSDHRAMTKETQSSIGVHN